MLARHRCDYNWQMVPVIERWSTVFVVSLPRFDEAATLSNEFAHNTGGCY